MVPLLTNSIKSAVAVILTASLLICCCQTHLLLAGVSGGDAPTTCSAVVSGGCCTERAAQPRSDETPAPRKGCQSCCIKGTGLKDRPLPLDVGVAVTAILPLPVAIVAPVPHGPDRAPSHDTTRLHLEPTTLVRLHCALLV